MTDIHGCLEEFDELVQLTRYRPGHDRLWILGDLLDRGPDSVGVLRKSQEYAAKCLLGNHEYKYVRYRNHELKKSVDPFYKNPMKFDEEKLKIYRELNDNDWDYIFHMDHYARFLPGLVGVHAGFLPNIPLNKQPIKCCLMLRYLDPTTNGMVGLHQIDYQKHVNWVDVWNGPDSVLYGHQPNMGEIDWQWDKFGRNQCIGLDTGCCFGGKLSALVLNDNHSYSYKEDLFCEYIYVSAKKKYSKSYLENE